MFLGAQGSANCKASTLHAEFAEVYGSRWVELQRSLALPTQHVALQNAFTLSTHAADVDRQEVTSVGPIRVRSPNAFQGDCSCFKRF